MKIIFILSTLLFVLFSCGDDNGPIEDNPDTPVVENFKISGVIDGAVNVHVYLEAMSQQGTIEVAKCVTDEKGNFEILSNIPDMGIFQLRLGESQTKIITLPLVPKDNVKLTTTFENYHLSPLFTGTEWSENITKYISLFSDFASRQESLSSLQGKVTDDVLMKQYLSFRKPIDLFCLEAVNNDPSNPLNFILTSFLAPNMGFKNWDIQNLFALQKMSAAYANRYKNSPIATNLVQQVQQIENNYNQYKTLNAGKTDAPEIALQNPDGVEMTLSSLRGKYVLIDFWASWCSPCRHENPNVVRLYNQYKDKGFTVMSVSLDSDIGAWKNAIKEDGLVWPNHVSDLSGWDSSMPNLYGFQSIPHTVLVDKEGKIIEAGLRGESLEQKLKELIEN